MTDSISYLYSKLKPDAWRKSQGFSPEVEEANLRLFEPGLTNVGAEQVLGAWLQKHQPCLFGRIAAKLNGISYCILSEADLERPDEVIKDKIQTARLAWTRDGFEGKKSAFIILAISPRIANALPGSEMRELARRLCHLYLETNIEMDYAHLEQIYLQKPGARMTTWKWFAGVNYFCAQGDKRWWQDHRIPGGMALSINSVGHLVKSGMISKAMKELDGLMDAPDEGYPEAKIDSLAKALDLAMRTIDKASEAVSGKATVLLPLPDDRSDLPVPKCPVKLSDAMSDKNYCEYRGHYHTDYTLPSEYFLADVARPEKLKVHSLDFTYLFHKNIVNPDFRLMGEGHQIRRIDGDDEQIVSFKEDVYLQLKQLTGEAEEELISEHERLRIALWK
ncbi:MAG: hypothetical protein WCF57_24415 [Pyrinomonadaceae bacterium]